MAFKQTERGRRASYAMAPRRRTPWLTALVFHATQAALAGALPACTPDDAGPEVCFRLGNVTQRAAGGLNNPDGFWSAATVADTLFYATETGVRMRDAASANRDWQSFVDFNLIDPPSRFAPVSVAYDGQAHLVASGSSGFATTSVFRFDIEDGSMEEIFGLASDELRPERLFHGSAATPDHLLIFGGTLVAPQTEQESCRAQLIDLDTRAAVCVPGDGQPSPREEAFVAWTGKEYIVWGGARGSPELDDGALLDPETGSWKPIGFQEVIGVYFPSAVMHGSTLVSFGGYRGFTYHPEGETYDLASGESRRIPFDPALARVQYGALAEFAGEVYFAGATSNTIVLARLDMRSLRFVVIGCLGEVRTRSLVLVGGSEYLSVYHMTGVIDLTMEDLERGEQNGQTDL